jgi:septum formation protein
MNRILSSPRVHLILASASPRRNDLLNRLGLRFRVVPADVEETLYPGESPEEYVTRLASLKARTIAVQFPDLWVLGADTIVVIDGEILGKPQDDDDARAMLARLAGRYHEVFTGYAFIRGEEPEQTRVRWIRSEVFIRHLSTAEIAAYVCTREPMDKAGSYAVQGIGSGIVERISGSYTNVVGLPLCEVARDLKDLEIYDFLPMQCS